MQAINNNWYFTEQWSEDFFDGVFKGEEVRIPHTNKMLPYHYADHHDYEMICGYRKYIHIPEDIENKRIFVVFEAAGHIATVYVNKHEVMTHKCGYTAFEVEISDYVEAGKECELLVKLDSTENGSVPPFGFVIDYLTYGGIYRPVWLDIRDKEFIADVFVTTPTLDTVRCQITVDGDASVNKNIRIYDDNDQLIGEKNTDKNDITLKVPDVLPWSADSPVLYKAVISLAGGKGAKCVSFGFRTAEFKADGFYLNGEKVFLRGLNRHQSYPYIGYAATDSLQKEDARILKEELCVNAVRTSHYPQAQSFIDECDRLGLLVFTEIPGWQHLGDEAWKAQAIENVREMVTQYRNHPSVILWGVRINESVDCDELYKKTNELAHALDPSRSTSGVRYLLKSSLLEDVYAYNDFSHTGKNDPVRMKNTVTTDMSKALLISESNGHMFPTKSFDKAEIRQEHALRHARVLNGAMSTGEHAGCFQWCMFDYATHKDFGSGDKVCYHGVMDGFRNPKLASAVYASQGEKEPVLEVTSPLEIGDYPGGSLRDFYVLTNADEVRLYKNDDYVKTFRESEFLALNHGPLKIDDLIGDLLKSRENMTGEKERLVHDALVSASRFGTDGMPITDKLKMARALVQYRLSMKDLIELYGKYVGNWGGEAIVWRFDAVKNGKVVASKKVGPSSKLHLEVRVSDNVLIDGDTYDMAAVRIRVLNEFDNVAHYAQIPLCLSVSGPIEIKGPKMVTAEGGMTGTYIATTGAEGKASLTITSEFAGEITVEFEVRKQ